MRSDRVTVVFEEVGSYRLPELRFQWWDPAGQTLHEEVLPALQIEVAENPAWAREAGARQAAEPFRISWNYLWFLLVAVLCWWPGRGLYRRFSRWLQEQLGARSLPPLNPGSIKGSSE